MSLEEDIRQNLSSPQQLERIFRSSEVPDFIIVIQKLYKEDPSNLVLSIWNERLTFDSEKKLDKMKSKNSQLWLVILLSVCGGLYAKLPQIFLFLNAQTFYYANFSFFVFIPLTIFFVVTKELSNKTILTLAIPSLICLAYANSMHLLFEHGSSHTEILAYIHMPFVLFSILGVSYLGSDFRNNKKRIEFLSYIGETLIYSGIILIGGSILSTLTVLLFYGIGVGMEIWYEWVTVFGLVATPIVATYISTNRLVLSGKIAPLMAKIFSPLFLITLAAYLFFSAYLGKSPFLDREFLIVFNVMLILVLSITVYAIVERQSDTNRSVFDYVNFALLTVALLINVIALTAILFRLASFGLTPNRIAVLGTNITIFVHLLLIANSYFSLLRGRATPSLIQYKIAWYLPVYMIWAALVTFVFPSLFNFR